LRDLLLRPKSRGLGYFKVQQAGLNEELRKNSRGLATAGRKKDYEVLGQGEEDGYVLDLDSL
jgi:hypothetical protein